MQRTMCLWSVNGVAASSTNIPPPAALLAAVPVVCCPSAHGKLASVNATGLQNAFSLVLGGDVVRSYLEEKHPHVALIVHHGSMVPTETP